MVPSNASSFRGARSRRGQALLMVTLSLPLIFGLLGLVLDVGWMYWRREACVTAAQAGAYAAAAHASKLSTTYPVSGGSSTTSTTGTGVWLGTAATACPTSPTKPPVNNFQTACLFAEANGFNPSNSRQAILVAASNGSTATVPNVSPAYYVTVTVSETVPLTFLATVTGKYLGTASASATGGIIATPAAGGCLYLLDPTGKDALNASNNAQIQPSCGVYVNSSNAEAAIATGSASVTTSGTPQPPIQIVGGAAANNNGSYHPGVTHSAAVADPLATLDTPWTNCTGSSCATTTCQYTGCATASNVCDYTNFSVTSGSWGTPYRHISPGVYCNGISISNGNSVIFDSGMYVINGGSISIMSGSGNSGSNVIFYFTGTNATVGGLAIANGAMATFTAPTTGDLADVLVDIDRTLTNPTNNIGINIQGGTTATLTGILYAPNSTADFGNGTTTTNGTSLIAKDANFNGGSYVFTTDAAGTLKGQASAAPFLIGSN